MLIDYQKVSIYQADKCVLKDVNFHLDEGEFTYLIGKVGSGKSSLLKTLYCELDLVEGETEKAEILGRDLKTIKRKEIPALRKQLGIIFQEQQRIAIARAILNYPKIIIADEPTGNLDPETASNIVSLLKGITKQGTAVLMTTHNIPMLDKFPGIVYRCKDGMLYDVTKEYNHIDLTEDGEEN